MRGSLNKLRGGVWMIHVPVETRWHPWGAERGGSSFALLNPPPARLGNEAFKEEKWTFPSEKCARRDKKKNKKILIILNNIHPRL